MPRLSSKSHSITKEIDTHRPAPFHDDIADAICPTIGAQLEGTVSRICVELAAAAIFARDCSSLGIDAFSYHRVDAFDLRHSDSSE